MSSPASSKDWFSSKEISWLIDFSSFSEAASMYSYIIMTAKIQNWSHTYNREVNIDSLNITKAHSLLRNFNLIPSPQRFNLIFRSILQQLLLQLSFFLILNFNSGQIMYLSPKSQQDTHYPKDKHLHMCLLSHLYYVIDLN